MTETETRTISEAKADAALSFYTLGDEISDPKAPAGPVQEKWSTRKFEAKLVNPANRRKLTVIIVGTGENNYIKNKKRIIREVKKK